MIKSKSKLLTFKWVCQWVWQFLFIRGAKLLRSAVEHRLRLLEPYLDSWPQVGHMTSASDHMIPPISVT